MAAHTVRVIVVSDTAAAQGAAADASAPLIASLLPSDTFAVRSPATIVPDDKDKIQAALREAIESGAELVLTTGGTGFGKRDVTPEVVAPLITRPAPGIVHLMLGASLEKTPLAALSRPVAGVATSAVSSSLIVTLPGSPKAVREILDALKGVLPHALELLRGGDGKETHKQMGLPDRASAPMGDKSHSHGHHHHHHHSGHHHGHGHTIPTPRTRTEERLSKDPSSSVASRQRKSPYPLLSTRDAIQRILDNTPSMPIQTRAIDSSLTGHVLAEDVCAAADVPATETTNVDGYALRSTDPAGLYRVLTPATFPAFDKEIPAGSIYRINTGAPLPPGTDSVIMVEDTLVEERDATTDEELVVRTLAQVDRGENVRGRGSDVPKGGQVLSHGDVISVVGGEIGSLAFVGRKLARVYRKPTVAVLSTGNELVDVNSSTSSLVNGSTFNGIPDTNRPSLLALLAAQQYPTFDLGIVGDDAASTANALKRGKEHADVVITTGGTSMGVGDVLKPVLERDLGGDIVFGRVAMKPGKPTTFATLAAHPMDPNSNRRLVFGLPGNPASALVTFFVFVLPALRKLDGRRESEWELPRVPVEVSYPISLDSRAEYHRVTLRPTAAKDGRGPSLVAHSTGGQRSSRTVSLAHANGLLELPARSDAQSSVAKGELVDCLLIGEMASAL